MLGESIGMAAEVAHGSCTDLPPGKKSTLQAPTKKSRQPERVGGFF
jgi:hypothetical protein